MKTTLRLFGFYFFLAFTGSVSAQSLLPVSDFSSNSTTICPGQVVQFSDLSQNNPNAWVWTFKGGSPATSTAQNPSIVYNQTGKYDVILASTNSHGTQAVGKLVFITVSECTSLKENHRASDLKVFPNPAKDFVNLLSHTDSEYTLINALGSVVLTGSLKKDELYNLSLNNLPSGIYIVSINNGLAHNQVKLIKE